jgi:hypothetical protein
MEDAPSPASSSLPDGSLGMARKRRLSVSGEAGDVTVEAKAATFSEIVDAIIDRTGMQISVEGTDVPAIDGDFHGSVRDVLTEMLRNMSFLISAPGDDADQPGLRVVIFGPAVEPRAASARG